MRRRTVPVRVVAALAVAVALAATACGTPSRAASGQSAQERAEEAGLKFAQCMRQHGVDMPDPSVGNHGEFEVHLRAGAGDKAKVDRAQAACQKYLKGIKREISPEERTRMQDAALKFARCMRAHGIDVPDPDFSRGQGILIGGPDSKIDPNDPAFQRAQEACQHYLPNRGRVTTGGGD
jgi:hypothetical protein